LGAETHAAGDALRAILPQEKQEAALDALRRSGARLISLTPVRTSLEDYFVRQLGQNSGAADGAQAREMAELSSGPAGSSGKTVEDRQHVNAAAGLENRRHTNGS
jgi:hypothetical protein